MFHTHQFFFFLGIPVHFYGLPKAETTFLVEILSPTPFFSFFFFEEERVLFITMNDTFKVDRVHNRKKQLQKPENYTKCIQ